jgi:hypothetical protein
MIMMNQCNKRNGVKLIINMIVQYATGKIKKEKLNWKIFFMKLKVNKKNRK